MIQFVRPAAVLTALLASTVPAAAQRGPSPAQTGLTADILALACAPGSRFEPPDTPLRVTGGQDAFSRRNYAPGDLVTVNAGAMNGITVGQEFFVRRMQESRFRQSPADPVVVRTAGWLRIYAVDDTMSLATVTHACDSIEVGDFLEPFALPQPVVANAEKPAPERDHYARVMAGSDRRSIFGRGDFFTINRGSSEGLRVGAQFVIYRDKHEATNFLYELGEAVAVNVGPQVSTLEVTLARDALQEGDYVAERK
jgi:hypothetical protein